MTMDSHNGGMGGRCEGGGGFGVGGLLFVEPAFSDSPR